ncbi:peptidoglycan-associated lipoprotein Pal [Mailhella massiliensis]|uniref:Peptidoglycan-associated lipoprotein n=1 Tax=Mailhella massiliensis TaxID=1903261 RepID=A0A921AUV9_9BACT|nr:peptidoglycan-associated lipoprotein Pal [Mailhella massiliensis]HJD96807.1 peptidoglycan-associated lipoprotein Pal [Mailhella massiliensis]
MKSLKSFGLVVVLALALGMGAGCAKKNAEVENVEAAPVASTSAVDAAAQQITDGVVYFDFDKYDIKAEYRDMLQQKAELMKQFPSIRVRIEGNCDERGTQEYNLALGERRARAAYEYMIRLGVPAEQLDIISYGKERPAVEGTGEAVWAQNRRDEFNVIAR